MAVDPNAQAWCPLEAYVVPGTGPSSEAIASRFLQNPDGDLVLYESPELARRAAWERWALAVIGDRLEWDEPDPDDPDPDPSVSVLSIDRCACVLGRLSAGLDFINRKTYSIGDEEGDLLAASSVQDPVEALVRLAGLVYAVIGPLRAPDPTVPSETEAPS